MKKVILVAGARPNFMKIAPIIEVMKKHQVLKPILVHTGQHYDDNMSKIFFDNLHIPRPHINLEVGSGTHAKQTAEIMVRFEDVLVKEKPELVIVVGDVNSTIACSLTAVKMNIKVAHVEAGLRSHNRGMPEEINRIITDHLSDFLFTTSKDANENLRIEGIQDEKIFFVGNVMIDSLLNCREQARKSTILNELKLERGGYAVLTLHRPSNVDGKESLTKILETLSVIERMIPIVYPIHPRTRMRLKEFRLLKLVESMKNLLLLDPVGYLDFLKLEDNAKFVMTDSGGIQEETTYLGIPCLTLRDETERPVTIEEGTNIIVGKDRTKILENIKLILASGWKEGNIPELWDGNAAQRIVTILREMLTQSN